MIDRLLAVVRDQVLLADIGDIAAFAIFGEQMVKGLMLVRPDLLGNGLVPFFRIGEDGIDIEHHPAKAEKAVLHDIADAEAGVDDGRGCNIGSENLNRVVHVTQFRMLAVRNKKNACRCLAS